ncbi:MAG: hypothetical protein HOE90_15040 [Bacteriovoracaceae bacterium]|jgi:hypothetical protein|nr:hypothetical protein [Bacteriovoracaceae bacterium]
MKKFLVTLSLCLSFFSGTAHSSIVLMASGLTVFTAGTIKSGGYGVDPSAAIGLGTLFGGIVVGSATIFSPHSTHSKFIALLVLNEDGVRKISTKNLDEAAIPILQNAIKDNYSEQEMRDLVKELSN